ncbi:hypothetical protein [Fluviicola taffensis]|uniref:hypothetical protein n=1 Tax=Fluviicola taffensis TaxID=191579 RepID=UPI00030F4E87|nr:hypothetical protein [Fluviicola taffensis]
MITLQGWCSPIALFRALRIRIRPEIDREKYALKILRGDSAIERKSKVKVTLDYSNVTFDSYQF